MVKVNNKQTRRTFKMAGTIEDMCNTMLKQIPYEDIPLLTALLRESTTSLAAIYVAANLGNQYCDPPEMAELQNAREFVKKWWPSVLPLRVAEVTLRLLASRAIKK